MLFISYAQNYEDVMLWRALRNIEKGFYIDIGANDPVQHSVTKIFYDRGWRGINIEPVEAWVRKLRLARPEDINLQVAASNAPGELNFFEVVDTGLSTTNPEFARRHASEHGFSLREYSVPATTLTQICLEQKVQDIHFLKIDVEGSEQSVLEGIDFSTIRPWILVVEATLPLIPTENHQDWEFLIVSSKYHFVYFDGINRFYVADEHSQLDFAFHSPPNVWDGFIPAREYAISQQCQHLQGQYQHLQGQYQHLQGQYQYLQGQYQHLSKEMYDLKHGRLWRLTAPFRRVGDLERYLKQRFRQKTLAGDRLRFRKSKIALKKMLLRTAQQNPGLTSAVVKLLPQSIRQVLKAKVTQTPTAKLPAIEDLSDYAVEFFHTLKSERMSK